MPVRKQLRTVEIIVLVLAGFLGAWGAGSNFKEVEFKPGQRIKLPTIQPIMQSSTSKPQCFTPCIAG